MAEGLEGVVGLSVVGEERNVPTQTLNLFTSVKVLLCSVHSDNNALIRLETRQWSLISMAKTAPKLVEPKLASFLTCSHACQHVTGSGETYHLSKMRLLRGLIFTYAL